MPIRKTTKHGNFTENASGTALLRRVVLTNYKSIASCDVQLGPLTFLVGPNGVGKSNFLDSLSFLAKCLQTSPETAFEPRGGFSNVRRRPAGRSDTFSIAIEFQLGAMKTGRYEVEFRQKKYEFSIRREVCHIISDKPKGEFHFEINEGRIRNASMTIKPPASADRLYLVHAAGLREFRPAYDALSRLSVYNINPSAIRQLKPNTEEEHKNAPDVLHRDGSNAPVIIARLVRRSPDRLQRIFEYLKRIVPWIIDVQPIKLSDGIDAVQFRMFDPASERTTEFSPASVSDGTLRALGVLLALFQVQKGGPGVPVVGIEEPEVALHPAASGILLDALFEASASKQVIVTSHSPDLLDNQAVRADHIVAVSFDRGATKISAVGEAERSVLHEQLYTAGELMRINQLTSVDSSSQTEKALSCE